MTMTTIKVPVELRDEIAERAERGGTTMAGAIRQALDLSDEERFWRDVREQHSRAGGQDRRGETALKDDLEDRDDARISELDQW